MNIGDINNYVSIIAGAITIIAPILSTIRANRNEISDFFQKIADFLTFKKYRFSPSDFVY